MKIPCTPTWTRAPCSHIGLGLDYVYDSDAMTVAMASQSFVGRRTDYDRMRRYFA